MKTPIPITPRKITKIPTNPSKASFTPKALTHNSHANQEKKSQNNPR